MDDVYEAARKRRDELQIELKTLNDFIDVYQRTRQLLGLDSREHKENSQAGAPSGTATVQASPATPSPAGDEPKRTRVTDNPPSAEVIRAVKDIMFQARRPFVRRELHRLLAQRGLEVRGVDPIKTLGTILWRAKDDIVSLPEGGYWVRGVPLPEHGYDPSSPQQLDYDHLLDGVRTPDAEAPDID